MSEVFNSIAWSTVFLGLLVAIVVKRQKVGYALTVLWFIMITLNAYLERRLILAIMGTSILIFVVIVAFIASRHNNKSNLPIGLRND